MEIKYNTNDIIDEVMLNIKTDGLIIKKFIDLKFIPMLKEDSLVYMINTFKPLFMPNITPFSIGMTFKVIKKVGHVLLKLSVDTIGEQTFQELLDLEPELKETTLQQREELLLQTKGYFDETLKNQIQFTIIHAQTEMIRLLEEEPKLKETPEVLLDKILISQFGLSAIGIKNQIMYTLDKEYTI